MSPSPIIGHWRNSGSETTRLRLILEGTTRHIEVERLTDLFRISSLTQGPDHYIPEFFRNRGPTVPHSDISPGHRCKTRIIGIQQACRDLLCGDICVSHYRNILCNAAHLCDWSRNN